MIKRVDASPRNVRNFGFLFAVLGLLATGFLIYKGNGVWIWTACAAVFFGVAGAVLPSVLKPVYVGWMTFAFVLGWINTRILLGVFYYVILAPIGLAMRLAGKDFLDEKIDRAAKSYWTKREQRTFDPARYERLF